MCKRAFSIPSLPGKEIGAIYITTGNDNLAGKLKESGIFLERRQIPD